MVPTSLAPQLNKESAGAPAQVWPSAWSPTRHTQCGRADAVQWLKLAPTGNPQSPFQRQPQWCCCRKLPVTLPSASSARSMAGCRACRARWKIDHPAPVEPGSPLPRRAWSATTTSQNGVGRACAVPGHGGAGPRPSAALACTVHYAPGPVPDAASRSKVAVPFPKDAR